jgi:hypothetical protein
MKRSFYVVSIAATLLITTSMSGQNQLSEPGKNQAVHNIFVRYDPAADDLLLSDTNGGPEKPSHDHARNVAKGDIIKWHWRGNHQNIEFKAIRPKEDNPFSQVDSLSVPITAYVETNIDEGEYGYDIIVLLNGVPTSFDPTIQIH